MAGREGGVSQGLTPNTRPDGTIQLVVGLLQIGSTPRTRQNKRRRSLLNDFSILVRGVLALSALGLGVAHADDGDIDLVGPTGESSLSLRGGYQRAIDTVDDGFGSTARGRFTGFNLAPGAVLAINDRLSVFGHAYWTMASRYDSPSSGNFAAARTRTGTQYQGADLGLAVNLMGASSGQPGFRLNGLFGYSKPDVGHAQYTLSLQPQYRFNDVYALSSSVSIARTPGQSRTLFAQVATLWRLAPQWSLTPSIGWQQFQSDNTNYRSNAWSEGMGLTYRVDPLWSASVGLDLQQFSAPSVTVNSTNLSLGLRRSL